MELGLVSARLASQQTPGILLPLSLQNCPVLGLRPHPCTTTPSFPHGYCRSQVTVSCLHTSSLLTEMPPRWLMYDFMCDQRKWLVLEYVPQFPT